MRGRVLGVDARTGDGLVSGDDGRRYRFGPADWAARGEPVVGADVDFEIDRDRALSLFPLPSTGGLPAAAAHAPPVRRSDRSKLAAALLAFLFGSLGLHRFYLGRTGSGLAMLILTITVVGLAISLPWALVDTVRLLVMGRRDFDRRYGEA